MRKSVVEFLHNVDEEVARMALDAIRLPLKDGKMLQLEYEIKGDRMWHYLNADAPEAKSEQTKREDVEFAADKIHRIIQEQNKDKEKDDER